MLVSDLPGFREYAQRTPGALHFFSPTEPRPLGTAISELLSGSLADPDPSVLALAGELSMERTVRSLPGRRSRGLAERTA